MNKNLSGFSNVLTSFFNLWAGYDGRTSVARKNRITMFSLIKRRRIYSVVFIFLLTFCYQIPSSALIHHKEGVIHNNAFENHSFFRQSKNDGDLYLDFYFNLQSDFLTSKICAYELIYLDEINPKGIIDFLFTAQKGRDGPVRLIP